MTSNSEKPISQPFPTERVVMPVLFMMGGAHMINDILQSLIPAIYPVIRDSYRLSYSQITMITFTAQMCGSIFQPIIGMITDKRPQPWSLVIGMTFSLTGLVLLALAQHYGMLLLAVGITGIGSSIFHPEASRLARLASGGKHGLAQSIFQVGGNFGTSLGPLLAALVITPYGQSYVLWFAGIVAIGIFILSRAGAWYSRKLAEIKTHFQGKMPLKVVPTGLSTKRVVGALSVLVLLVFSKQIYLASMTNFYTFYLKDRFGVSNQTSQFLLFVFLFSVACGTLIGGPIGDRIGRKKVIWISILGVAPFTLVLPHVDFAWTITLSVIIGLVLASAFSAILVFAQELVPGKVGLIAGLFFGLAFGTGGMASAFLGRIADKTSIEHVFFLCSFLPLIGLAAALLPNTKAKKSAA